MIPNYAETKNIVGKKKIAELRKIRRDDELIKSELFASMLGEARYWWTVCDKDYYYDYAKNMDKADDSAIAAALKKYIVGKNAFVVVVVNPSVYKSLKAEFDAQGFEEIKKENAFGFESENGEAQ